MKQVVSVMLLVLAFGVAGAEVIDTMPAVYSRFELVEGTPRLDSVFTLRFSGKTFHDLPSMTVLVTVPRGVYCLEDSTRYRYELAAGDTFHLDVRLRVDSAGPYVVTAHSFTSDADTLSIFQHFVTDFYVLGASDTAVWDTAPLQGVDGYNLICDDVVGDGSPGYGNHNVHGIFQYRDQDSVLHPTCGIQIQFFDEGPSGRIMATAWTDSLGWYSVSLGQGNYTMRAWAKTTDAEVHPAWYLRADWFNLVFWPPTLVLSPPPHCLKQVNIRIGNQDVVVNHTATGKQANFCRLLDVVASLKAKMLEETGVTLTDYLEITYPAVCSITFSYWPFGETASVVDMGDYAPAFALPIHALEGYDSARIRLAPGWWLTAQFVASGRSLYQIVVADEDLVWGDLSILEHEWSHIFQFQALGHKVPLGHEFAEHLGEEVTRRGFALAEGFADFQGEALDLAIGGGSPSWGCEAFYANGDSPCYMGQDFTNTRGDSVEDAVMQFFQDLYDDAPIGGWDDDGVSNGWARLAQLQSGLGSAMTQQDDGYHVLGQWDYPDSLWVQLREYGIPGGDFTGWIRDSWGSDISELYNVDIHPFPYREHFQIPAPSGLTATPEGKQVLLSWQDNSINEGHFIVHCNSDSNICAPHPGTGQMQFTYDSLEFGTTYEFSIQAVTCDTSLRSNAVCVTPTPWVQMADVPAGPGNRMVKCGGCLAGATDGDGDHIYALKGNNTFEFYRYNVTDNSWLLRESIPALNQMGRRVSVKKGGTLVAGTNGKLYASKGGNTRDFWQYDPVANCWTQMADVPTGVRAIKEGTGAVAVEEGGANYVYFLKGSGTFEFYRYNADNNAWDTSLPLAPEGPWHTPYKNGSCLAYDGANTIYALKAVRNEFYAYSVSGKQWTSRETLPRVWSVGGKKRKVGGGAGLACLNNKVYALKGGNTNEVWTDSGGAWLAADSVPVTVRSGPLKRVKDGGSLAARGNALWALKGNNTREFYSYGPSGGGSAPGQFQPTSPGANEVAVATCANATATSPQWSPTGGEWVVYCRSDQNQSKLLKAPANGGQVTELASSSSSVEYSNPIPSPTGAQVAFAYTSGDSCSQIGVVPSGGGQVSILTSSPIDHGAGGVCWNSSGTGLYYTFDDASSGYTQLGYVSASGGSEQTVTTSSMAHSHPRLLSSTELILEGEDASDGSSQIFRLNLQNGQEVQLTSGENHENPCCAAGARLVGSEVAGDGHTGIAVFSADGGAENVITSGDYDYSAGSICYDGSALSCVRTGSSGSAVCVFDLVEGTCQVLTDDAADREAPDVQVVNSAQHLVSTTYIRDGDIYKADYLSSSGLVIAPNGFKAGIARDPNGNVHTVYSDGTLIRHEVQDQTGTVLRLDTPGYGDCASLSMSSAGLPVVVSRKGDSIFGSIQRPNNSWKRLLLWSAPASHHVGPPACAAFQVAGGRFINACVPCYDSCASATGTSMILFLQADTLGNVVLDTLDLCTGSYADSSVCMAVNSASYAIEAAYQRSESTFYRSVHLSPTDSTRPVLWTSPSRVNDSATTGRNPTCERRNGRFYVAFSEHWIDGKSGAPMWSIVRASCCDTVSGVVWEGRGPVSSVDSSHKDWPSISLTRVAWAESSSAANYWTIKANIADSQLTLSPDTSCVSCALLSDSTVLSGPATAMTRLRLVWLQKYGSTGDTWQVPVSEREVYAASADANVTMYNQGRKLCLDSVGSSTDSIRVVLRSQAASLWVAEKRDGDETWTSSMLRSTGDMPAIDQSQGRIWCCCRDVSTFPPGNVIRCQNRTIGSSTWHDFQVYFTDNPNPSSPRLGPPAIVASLYDTSGQNHAAAYIIFTAYTPTLPKSAVVMLKVDTAGNVIWTDTLHSVASLADSFADVALSAVAGKGYGIDASFQSTQATGGICYRKTTDRDQPQYSTKRSWSSTYNVMTGKTYRHPTLAASAETVLVAFTAGDSGRILTRGQAPGSLYNVWDDTVNVSQCKDTFTDWPSIALGESAIVSYQKRLSSTNYDVMARVNFHGSINLSNTPSVSSKYPHVAFHLHNDSFPVITAIWTEEQGPSTAEVGYKRWQLGLDGGGGIQDYSIFNPNIKPALYAPAPNPFSHSSSIRFSTNIRGLTRVSIMDITGRRVRSLLSTVEKPGVYNLTWNARDDRERKLAGGVYFVRLLTPNYHETRKVIMTE